MSIFLNPFHSIISSNNINIDVKFFSLLFCTLPVSLITGPAIPDITISLLALYFLIKIIFLKEWKYFKNKFFLIFMIFCFYGVIRSIFSELPKESISTEGSIFYFRYIFFAIAIWYLLDHNQYLSKAFLLISIICLIVVCTDGIYQYFYEVNLFGNPKYGKLRLTGLFQDEPIIGRYVSYIAIFIFYLFIDNFYKKKSLSYFFMLLLSVGEIVVFLSGERAPLFYLTSFFFITMMFYPNYKFVRVIFFTLSISIILVIINFNPNAKERIVDLTIEQVQETKLTYLPYSEGHERIYISSLKMYKENPIIGIGPNLFRHKCHKEKFQYKTDSCTSHPHNFYIQILSELGIIGLLFIISFYGFLIYGFFHYLIRIHSKKHILEIHFEHKIFILIVLLLIFLFPLVPTMSFYNNWNNIFIFLPIGFLLKNLYGDKYY